MYEELDLNLHSYIGKHGQTDVRLDGTASAGQPRLEATIRSNVVYTLGPTNIW